MSAKRKKRQSPSALPPSAKPVDKESACVHCRAGQCNQCPGMNGGPVCGCEGPLHREYPDQVEVHLHMKKHGEAIVVPECEVSTPKQSHSSFAHKKLARSANWMSRWKVSNQK